MEYTRFNLSEKSFLLISALPEQLIPEFEKLWDQHPDSKGKVLIYGRYIETPRWHQSYLKAYNFSGQTLGHNMIEPPTSVGKILDYINSNDQKYNQVLVNWYLNGHHYIGPHSDDERQLTEGSPICSISLGATRKFRFRNKNNKKIVKDIELVNGQVVIMCGRTQKEYTHEIVKINGNKGRGVGKRINITFRQFKN